MSLGEKNASATFAIPSGAAWLCRIAQKIGPAPFILVAAALLPMPEPGGATIAGIPTLCLFQRLTGFPCPGCGMTRSVVCCAHGDFAAAFAFHPLGPVVFIGLLCAALSRIPLFQRLKIPPTLATFSGAIGLILLFGVWALRLLYSLTVH